MENSKQCLEYIVKLLVIDKDAVRVEANQGDTGVLLELNVSSSDMGRVIGKQGMISKALRTIIRSVGSMEKENVGIQIIEPEGSRFSKPISSPPIDGATANN